MQSQRIQEQGAASVQQIIRALESVIMPDVMHRDLAGVMHVAAFQDVAAFQCKAPSVSRATS